MPNYTFIYDDACPLCQGYTAGFARLGWSGREAFSTLKQGEWPTLDLERGRHEIPLVDNRSGKVVYGLEAMTRVVAGGLPFLHPLVRNRFFIATLKPLYWLITFNRRVIAGTPPPVSGFDCAPDFHPGWRWAYVGIMGLLLICGDLPVALGMAFGLALLSGLVVLEERLEFLGHLATVAGGACLIFTLLPAWPGLCGAYGFALWEGWRRSKLL